MIKEATALTVRQNLGELLNAIQYEAGLMGGLLSQPVVAVIHIAPLSTSVAFAIFQEYCHPSESVEAENRSR